VDRRAHGVWTGHCRRNDPFPPTTDRHRPRGSRRSPGDQPGRHTDSSTVRRDSYKYRLSATSRHPTRLGAPAAWAGCGGRRARRSYPLGSARSASKKVGSAASPVIRRPVRTYEAQLTPKGVLFAFPDQFPWRLALLTHHSLLQTSAARHDRPNRQYHCVPCGGSQGPTERSVRSRPTMESCEAVVS